MINLKVNSSWILLATCVFASEFSGYELQNLEEFQSMIYKASPGYELQSLEENLFGLTAKLSLAGPACNAFGIDISNLTIEVTYETTSRLHVNIFDTAQKQFTIPEEVISRPPPPTDSFVHTSDLVFNYQSSPFAFWITRRTDSEGLEASMPLFDTRIQSLPTTPINNLTPNGTRIDLDGFPLVFENQYLQLTSALPFDTNIYGLGEVVASSGLRRDVGTGETGGTVQTMWATGASDPIDGNMYGSHPFYMEHRFSESSNMSQSHGVFLMSSAGSDILLLTPPSSNVSLVQYRMIGGVMDFYFFSGPNPKSVIEQYGEMIGLPAWIPAWGFGFQLCRWGYTDINETRAQVENMRAADIPLEVIWNDIDLYHAFRSFTSDPVSFPAEEMRSFIQELASNDQKYIPILDAALAKVTNATDIYDPYIKGAELDAFVKNPAGSEYIGQVWPGYTVFPDWFRNTTQDWWTEALLNWSLSGIEFSGIWLDKNEVASFCTGSCGTGANLSNPTGHIPPGNPGGNPVLDYPECYDSSVWGPSGNISINGTLTFGCDSETSNTASFKRELVKEERVRSSTDFDVNTPPYAIHNGFGLLSNMTLATNATHAGGLFDLEVHNMWGMMEEKATHLALQQIQPSKRPSIIARSTFPSTGKWAGHWLGDNFSRWQYIRFVIQGVLQFQMFQIPFVGAHCRRVWIHELKVFSLDGNTDEELCNRWMQLAAFMPFFRNHNVHGAIGQEPYRWDSVAEASRTAIATRYSLLPLWYTLFANASTQGTPPVRALFFKFPDEPDLFSVDTQFLIGRDILVTPVLSPNVSSVEAILPGGDNVVWRDFYTHAAVSPTVGNTVTLPAPLGHINVHVRDESVILLHAKPAYTTEKTRQGPYSLLCSVGSNGQAFGSAFIDDGISNPPGDNTTITFTVSNNTLRINPVGAFQITQMLQEITVLGVPDPETRNVSVQGRSLAWTYFGNLRKLSITNVSIDLNEPQVIEWM
ncbi:hypothetical protein K435DRAFT_885246 [Dendrothele bispora CBS 962.96]|uniref:Maltase n=1 Tax=Dendrothele bispora (strain CBS 962.96) TaxID=1314807 RepID=A0A4S8M7B8_DENBC|nr:hypothetical protein K435DRAFT_885246 [Dendrothele bispora CBS 962.96]